MIDENDSVMFEQPPVAEAALCVVFKPISSLRALHFGVFWQKIRSEYPVTEVQPPIPHQIEQFNIDPGRLAQQQPAVFPFPFPFGDDAQRYLFVGGDRSRVVQLQRDRFIINWRKNASSGQYPEYKKELRDVFSKRWKDFSDFLDENQIVQPEIEQSEVTYVNNIQQGDGWNSLADLSNVIAPWSGKLTDHSVPSLEALTFNAVFVVPENRGRVHVNLSPSVIADGTQLNLQLVITARVIPVTGQSTSLLDLMDLAHHWGVKSFAAFTSDEMHKRWKRKM